MTHNKLPRRITSFELSGRDWLMMERLVNRHKEAGQGAFASKKEMMDRALDLLRPVLEEEYRKVFGVNPPSGD